MNEKEINMLYIYLQSQLPAQNFLFDQYKKIEEVQAKSKSFQNCNSFIYYLKHGKQFYDSGKNESLIIKPTLLFYGMAHLIKASLLTTRPDYPETTKILAHGVSTRKRKKRDYTFMHDEVKIQYHGLFPYFSEHLFNLKNLSINKFKMNHLMALIPEMSTLFTFSKQRKLFHIGEIGSTVLRFPITLLKNYQDTTTSFTKRINPYLPPIIQTNSDQKFIHVELSIPITESSGPFFFNIQDKGIYFPIDKVHFLPISEVMIHYLLLYNLSMLCRYETEWWGDLLVTKPNMDYSFIVQFLELTSEKIPLLLGQSLYNDYMKQ